MECEKSICPVLKIDGVLATGKQFDLDITLPEDNRSVIYGVVKDCCHDPICNAVVKLVEVDHDCGKEERRPVSHTLFDETLNTTFLFILKVLHIVFDETLSINFLYKHFYLYSINLYLIFIFLPLYSILSISFVNKSSSNFSIFKHSSAIFFI